MRILFLFTVSAVVFFLACGEGRTAGGEPGLGVGTLVRKFDSPGGGVTGLAWGDGSLWALDSDTETLFRLDPSDGMAVDSFSCRPPSDTYHVTGLAYGGRDGLLWVGMWDGSRDGYVIWYDTNGGRLGSMSMCGG